MRPQRPDTCTPADSHRFEPCPGRKGRALTAGQFRSAFGGRGSSALFGVRLPASDASGADVDVPALIDVDGVEFIVLVVDADETMGVFVDEFEEADIAFALASGLALPPPFAQAATARMAPAARVAEMMR